MNRTWSLTGGLILLALIFLAMPVMACDACYGQAQIGSAASVPDGGDHPVTAADTTLSMRSAATDDTAVANATTPCLDVAHRTFAGPMPNRLRLACPDYGSRRVPPVKNVMACGASLFQPLRC
jgi:hypothetical protein